MSQKNEFKMNPMGCITLERVCLEVQMGWVQLAQILITNYKILEVNIIEGKGRREGGRPLSMMVYHADSKGDESKIQMKDTWQLMALM